MKKTRRFLALLLVVALAFMQLPVMALAITEDESDQVIIAVPEETISTTPPSYTMTTKAPTGTVTAFDELPMTSAGRTPTSLFSLNSERYSGWRKRRNSCFLDADHYYDSDSPESGLYVFTARMEEGYTLDDGVEVPRITVYIPTVK
jgi:hypothetical protein